MQLINVIYNITYNNLYLMFPKNICSDLDSIQLNFIDSTLGKSCHVALTKGRKLDMASCIIVVIKI